MGSGKKKDKKLKESKKSVGEKFFVYSNGEDGELRKVNPNGKRFDGKTGDKKLAEATEINGHLYPAGSYPFIFWGVDTYDKEGNKLSSPKTDDAPKTEEVAPNQQDGDDAKPAADETNDAQVAAVEPASPALDVNSARAFEHGQFDPTHVPDYSGGGGGYSSDTSSSSSVSDGGGISFSGD